MQVHARTSKDPEVRREELLAAAGDLFQRVGYERTSVQMIADAVGVVKGLFYHYFRSKADLLNELVRQQIALFVEGLPRHAADMEGTALEKLRQIVNRASQWKLEDLRPFTQAYLVVMYRDENRALRSALISEYMRELSRFPLFAEIIEEAVSQGVAEVDDAHLAAELWMALGLGLNERMAELILALPEHPENRAALVERMRAFENGVERLLGMKKGVLGLYDPESLADALGGLLPGEASSSGASR